MNKLIVEINIARRKFYYEVRDDIAKQIYELQLEFGEWLRNTEGNHPFKEYNEFVESDGTLSFSGYVNTFGPDEFIAWLNVEKYQSEVATAVRNPSSPPGTTISF